MARPARGASDGTVLDEIHDDGAVVRRDMTTSRHELEGEPKSPKPVPRKRAASSVEPDDAPYAT
jgi:hypothetical protein